eukprot:TRINITY_DN400_c0_g2_i2.p1 TRINITY_DN400_c0_g2~~TRINITY_DN400_c0_g2_i2.p1  ORF type:complete len:171 (+),score=24.82 TRINITY_DN400_c0_g2_i2:36-515(+)
MSDSQHLISPHQPLSSYDTTSQQYPQPGYNPYAQQQPHQPQQQNFYAPPQAGFQQQPQYAPPPHHSSPPQHHGHHGHHGGGHRHFGEMPETITCQWCGVTGPTRTEYEAGALTYLSSGACCLFGLWMGCFLIPCCIDDLKDVYHYCGACRQAVGKYSRI